jgi:ankyrin repeat protein
MSNQGRALISALNAGDYQAVDQYTELGDLDLKIINHHVHELFERAIRTENFKLLRALIKIPRVQVSGNDYCALRHAAKQGLADFVSDIARVPSANANLLDKEGYTALHYAVIGKWTQKKAIDMVRPIMLISGIKVNIRSKESRTALHYACDKQWYDVAATLVDAGGHPKIEDRDGVSPLAIVLPNLLNVPEKLFERMLAFEDDLPEEEHAESIEREAVPDEDDHLYSHLPQNQHKNAGNGAQSSSPQPQHIHHEPPQQQPVQQPVVARPVDPEPVVRQVQTVVTDTYSDRPDTPPIVTAAASRPDTASLEDIMGDQPLDDTLVKEFLFLNTGDDPRMRLHRRAVLENLGEVAEALRRSGQRINAHDCTRIDGSTGYTLWHAAAKYEAFPALLDMLARASDLPTEDDLSAKAADGQTPATLLDNSAKLQAVLSNEFWYQHPRLLTAMITGLPDKRRRSFSTLIAKAHLLQVARG